MAKRLKLRLSRVFQTCHSKDPSNPVPSFLRLPPPNPLPISVHSPNFLPHPSHTPIKRHIIRSTLVSYGCGCRSTDHHSDDDCTLSHPPNLQRCNSSFDWKHEPDFHVVAKPIRKKNEQLHQTTPRRKIYTSSVVDEGAQSGDVDLPVRHASIVRDKRKKKRRTNKKKMMMMTGPMSLRVRISTSSGDTGCFLNSEDHEEREGENEDEEVEREEKGETETLVSSSKSFSTTDSSSEFHHRRRSKKKTKSLKNKQKKNRRKKKEEEAATIHGVGSEVTEEARLSVFRRMIPCTIEGKVRESFAVVKRTEDPYGDFKRSMVEMISEKEMFAEEDLVQLLHCFLSLNSKRFHGVIVEAFLEIWDGLFGVNGDGNCSSSSNRRRSL